MDPTGVLSGPPSFTQQLAAESGARAGGISSGFTSGAFNVGASSLTPLFIIAGLVWAAVTLIEKKA